MNKLSSIVVALAASTLIIMSSCETATEVTAPLVTVNPSAVVTAAPGEALTYQMLINSDTDLKTAEVSATVNNTVLFTNDTTFVAGLDAAIINFSFTVPSTMASGTVITLDFTASNGATTTVTRTVNVTIPAGEINSYTAVIMSDLENPNGSSFYSIEDNHLMKLSEAIPVSSEVDLIYYYGVTNKASLCAPADKTVEEFTGADNTSIVKKFATRNNTKLSKVAMTTAAFDAITNDVAIKSNAPATTTTSAITLAKDDIIWVETAGTVKKALIKVVSITGTSSTSYITIEVKVQK